MQSKRFQRDRGQLGVVVCVFNPSAQKQRPVGLSEVPNPGERPEELHMRAGAKQASWLSVQSFRPLCALVS